VLGFLIGIGLLGAIWLNARVSRGYPLISLALLVTNLTLLRWGDSLRGYGCGGLFVLLAFTTIGSLVQEPKQRLFKEVRVRF
jgi:hypothetical protein